MALTKPSVLPPWADAGDKVQPTNAEIQTGWPLSNVPPSRQRFNWLLNWLMNGVRYLTRRGMPDYAADETYAIGDRVIGDDGKTYRSIQAANTGNTPSSSPLWWERWGFTKAELTAELNNHDYKDSCRVGTTANLAALSGLLTVDGVVLVAGDRVLVKNQTTGSQNGIYVVAAGAWSRATDFDENSEVTAGALVPVEAGSTQADSLWMLTTDNPITVGAKALVFSQVNNGLTQAQADARYVGIGYMLVKDEKAQGTHAGASVIGIQTRTLNTVSANTISGASLASNQITLPTGTYRIRARAPAFINSTKGFFYNVTDAANAIIGYNYNGIVGSASDPAQSDCFIEGRITIGSAKVFEVRQYCSEVTAINGLGASIGQGTEVYTTVEIIKEF